MLSSEFARTNEEVLEEIKAVRREMEGKRKGSGREAGEVRTKGAWM